MPVTPATIIKPHGEDSTEKQWKVLIVDDEPEIHILTRTVLKELEYDGKSIKFLSAYSEAQARDLIENTQDIALILLDVVMEEENTGLNLIRYIREELKNHLTRIILRTGQPGQAPERSIIIDYEINDYKEKVDLTSHRLFTSVVKSLRNYSDLKHLEQINSELDNNRKGLTRIISSSTGLFGVRSLDRFYPEFMVQMSTLTKRTNNAVLVEYHDAGKPSFSGIIIYGRGRWAMSEGRNIRDVMNDSVLRVMAKVTSGPSILFDDDFMAGRLIAPGVQSYILLFDGYRSVSVDEQRLLEIFFVNIATVYNNLALEKEIYSTQSEMIRLLGDIIENRSRELRGHVRRVSEYAALLARKVGIPGDEIAVLRDAAPMHDVGKIGISDAIFTKAGPLSPEEFEVMKNHTSIGYDILKISPRRLFQMAALIALEHHERWDGKGYPRGIGKNQIHLLGRITGIADVFDALSSDRVYRKAWSFDKTMEFIKKGRETQFDPSLVDLFVEEPDVIHDIMTRYKT